MSIHQRCHVGQEYYSPIIFVDTRYVESNLTTPCIQIRRPRMGTHEQAVFKNITVKKLVGRGAHISLWLSSHWDSIEQPQPPRPRPLCVTLEQPVVGWKGNGTITIWIAFVLLTRNLMDCFLFVLYLTNSECSCNRVGIWLWYLDYT